MKRGLLVVLLQICTLHSFPNLLLHSKLHLEPTHSLLSPKQVMAKPTSMYSGSSHLLLWYQLKCTCTKMWDVCAATRERDEVLENYHTQLCVEFRFESFIICIHMNSQCECSAAYRLVRAQWAYIPTGGVCLINVALSIMLVYFLILFTRHAMFSKWM